MNLYEGNESYIFISYSHQDNEFMIPFVRKLSDQHVRFWYDNGLEKGANWMGELGTKIKDSWAVLALISRSYLDSYFCNKEMEYAINLKKDIIICYLEDVRSADWDWLLSGHQAILRKDYADVNLFCDDICNARAISACRTCQRSAAITASWGPKRPLYAADNLPEIRVLNSLIDNPEIGDERFFVKIREADSNQPFFTSVCVEPGKVYEVRIDYHNNANPELNPLGKGIAHGFTLQALFPKIITVNKPIQLRAILSSASCSPAQVWSEVSITTVSAPNVKLQYIAGSGKIHNRGYQTNGQVLSTSLFKAGTGVFLGVNKLDGRIPGGFEYAGYVTFRLYCSQISCRITRQVSTDGIHFSDHVLAGEGDTLTFRTILENTSSSADLMHVAIHDKIDKYLELVPGTTCLVNACHPAGLMLDDRIDKNGYKIGNYGPGSTATVTYQAKISGHPAKYDMNMRPIWYVNTSFIDHDDGELYANTSYMMK